MYSNMTAGTACAFYHARLYFPAELEFLLDDSYSNNANNMGMIAVGLIYAFDLTFR